MPVRGVLAARKSTGGAIALGDAGTEPFLYATTTAPAQTVTIHRITPTGGNITIFWGDGNTTTVAAGVTAAQAHVYAAAGTYEIRVTPLILVTQFDIHDAKLSGLRSTQLAGNSLVFFACYSIGNTKTNIIDTADMTGWNPASWYLVSMPSGTYAIDSSDMVGWNPTDWQLYSMPSGTYAIDSSDMVGWNPTDWRLYSMPSGTYAIDSSDMVGWNPTTWLMHTMPSGTYAIDSSDMVGWNPTTWRCYLMPPASTVWTIVSGDFAGFTKCTSFLAYSNALNQTQVNAILWGLYQAAIIPRTGVGGTINVGGTNAAPSGVYQPAAACPVSVATPGKEVAHELKNDGCGVGFNKWTTVTTS